MSPALVGLAVAVVAGGVVAVTVRDARVAVLGLALAGVLGPFLADPLPGALPLAARIVAALLVAYLLWVVLRADAPTRGSAIGWPAEALLAAACAVAGAGFAGAATAAAAGGSGPFVAALDGRPLTGPPEALVAGFALAALSVAPLAGGRDALRIGVGLLLAIHAALLVRAALAGPASELEQLAAAALVAVLGSAVAGLSAAAIRLTGGLALAAERTPAAHRLGAERQRPRFRLPERPPLGVRRSPAAHPSAPDPTAVAAVASAPDEPARSTEPPSPAEPDTPAPAPGPSGGTTVAPRSSGTRRIAGR